METVNHVFPDYVLVRGTEDTRSVSAQSIILSPQIH